MRAVIVAGVAAVMLATATGVHADDLTILSAAAVRPALIEVPPIYTKATDKRILTLLDKLPPAGYARWTGPLLAGELGDVDVQYVWRFLRSNKIDLAARKSWCESNDPQFTAKAADVVGLYVAPPRKAIVL